MFNRATRGHTPPTYLSSDHDRLYQYHQWQANLRILDVKEIKTVPYVPLSHPFVERLIGTIRRECLDRTLFWTAYCPRTRSTPLVDGETSRATESLDTLYRPALYAADHRALMS